MSKGEKAALVVLILLVIVGIIFVLWSGLGSEGNPQWSKPEKNNVVEAIDDAAVSLKLAKKEVLGPEQLDELSSCVSENSSTHKVEVEKGTCTIPFGTVSEKSKKRRYIAVRQDSCRNGGSLQIHWTPKLSSRKNGRRDSSTSSKWKYYFGMPRFGGTLELQVLGSNSDAACSLKTASKGE